MKIINDPVFGFIRVPKGILLDIVKHPAFFRLSRIRQLGGANLVYPGAQHTRFQHSIGAFHLMSLAVHTLQTKGCFIFDSEAEAVQAAILMHDIGHGPFSHVLEHTIITGVDHEEISLMIMEKLNTEMRGQLTLAIKIFNNEYPKKFLHQLISSQLDMDRLDYLTRDCFFTGVQEGNIGSSRIIDMLNVQDDQLVVEQKGIYSIENYLVSRRLMYWQVYLHKTCVAAENMLINALKRAKHLITNGHYLFCSSALRFFLSGNIDRERFLTDPQCLDMFLRLDDNDIMSALNEWQYSNDKILAKLSHDFVNRNIFKIETYNEPVTEVHILSKATELSKALGITPDEARDYFICNVSVGRDMYSLEDDNIEMLRKDGTVCDISEISDMLDLGTLARKTRKHYFCYSRL